MVVSSANRSVESRERIYRRKIIDECRENGGTKYGALRITRGREARRGVRVSKLSDVTEEEKVKMRGQLEMDKFFQNFARDRKNGDGPEVGWICTFTTFVEWPDGDTFPLDGKL